MTQLTLLRRLADAHYLNIYETDFKWRGDFWRKALEDEEAFWKGQIIKQPVNDLHKVIFARLTEALLCSFHSYATQVQIIERPSFKRQSITEFLYYTPRHLWSTQRMRDCALSFLETRGSWCRARGERDILRTCGVRS